MKPTVTWIVIADGGQAKGFEHDGPGKGLRAVKDVQLKQDNLKASDIMSDRPCSSQGGGAGAHSSMAPPNDPVAARERKFVEHLADVLEMKRAEGAFDRLVIGTDRPWRPAPGAERGRQEEDHRRDAQGFYQYPDRTACWPLRRVDRGLARRS